MIRPNMLLLALFIASSSLSRPFSASSIECETRLSGMIWSRRNRRNVSNTSATAATATLSVMIR